MKNFQRIFIRTIPNYIASCFFTAVLVILTVLANLQDTQTEAGWRLPVMLLLAVAAGLLMHLRIPDVRKEMAEPAAPEGEKAERSLSIFGLIWNLLWTLTVPALSVYLVQHFVWDPGRMYPKMLTINLLLYYLIFLTLAFALGSIRWGYCIAAGFFFLVGVINYFVMQFRSGPIVPWDLFSLRTAASVADNYTYDISWRFTLTAAGFIFILIVCWKCRFRLHKLPVRAAGAIIAAALLIFGTARLQEKAVKDWLGMDQTLFTPSVRYRNNGLLAAFLGNIHLINVEKPENYSPEKVEQLKGEIKAQSSADEAESAASARYPNIIIIMDEAFSDLQVRGSFGVNHDYMPYFRKMMEENAGGHLMVSVKGGNTANTEYEFLAGDTMAFLPSGSVVYQQFIHDDVPALPSQLSALGYATTAIHPYNASGWDRDTVYPQLGFDTFLSLKNFTNPVKVRDYVSDESAFDKIIEVFEENPDQPKFIFEVTMQNHSGYSKEYEGFYETVELTDLSYSNTQTKAVQKYLTLIEKSDQALEQMMQYFNSIKEPTIIVMFGDHQPGDYITNVIDRMTGYDPDSEDLEEAQKAYIVPCFVWNNFGMELDLGEMTSVNYLAADILEAAKVPLTTYQSYLLQLQKKIPVICAGTYIDAEGIYHSFDEKDEENEAELNNYNILQYNHLTDGGNRVEDMFTLIPEA